MAASGALTASNDRTPDWSYRNGDANETAFSPIDQIGTANVSRLGLTWTLDLPGEATLEATPLAVHGVLYFTGSYGAVYAVDGVSGKVIWKFDPETWRFNPGKMVFNFAANRGVAYADGRIFSAALDGRLFALDARTGRLVWSCETLDQRSVQTVTGAPRVFNGKVIIGNGGADYGARGYVTAYEAATGKQLWRFFPAPGSPEENTADAAMKRAAATWSGEFWKKGTGGAVWDSMTFDRELNRVYLGTGNAGTYDPELRSPGGGDNLYTASIVALDADTGRYVWHYQVNPRDAWDFDCTQQMTLASLVIDGNRRKVLMQAPKNGFFYVIDRTNGRLISAAKLGKATWAERIDLDSGRPVEARNIRHETGETVIWPSPAGAHSVQSMAFNPVTGLVYVPYMQLGVRFVKGEAQPGGFVSGGISVKAHAVDAEDGKGALIAWDPVRQKAAWKVPQDTMWNGGILTTAGNLVFQGSADGYLSAYSATMGERLWRFYGGMGIVGAPMSYMVNGQQYVAVLAGYGGSIAAWAEFTSVGWRSTGPRRLLTFALSGKAMLPPSPPRDKTVHALDDPSFMADPAAVAAGRNLYVFCGYCHGAELVSSGFAPDLRESTLALTSEGLWTVLHEGALLQGGMPRFGAMTRTQVNQLHAFIRSGARDVLHAGSDGVRRP